MIGLMTTTSPATTASDPPAGEPSRFVYLVEGEPHVGTVTDYARAMEEAHYAGLSVDTSRVWAFLGDGSVALKPAVTASGYDEDDYSTLTVRLGDETATARIDGRA